MLKNNNPRKRPQTKHRDELIPSPLPYDPDGPPQLDLVKLRDTATSTESSTAVGTKTAAAFEVVPRIHVSSDGSSVDSYFDWEIIHKFHVDEYYDGVDQPTKEFHLAELAISVHDASFSATPANSIPLHDSISFKVLGGWVKSNETSFVGAPPGNIIGQAYFEVTNSEPELGRRLGIPNCFSQGQRSYSCPDLVVVRSSAPTAPKT